MVHRMAAIIYKLDSFCSAEVLLYIYLKAQIASSEVQRRTLSPWSFNLLAGIFRLGAGNEGPTKISLVRWTRLEACMAEVPLKNGNNE